MSECRNDAPLHRRFLSPRVPVAALTVAWVGFTLPPDAPARAAPPELPLHHERANIADVLRGPGLLLARAADATGYDGSPAVDGRDDTAWAGRPGETQWRLTFLLTRAAHLGLLRAHWGQSPTKGVPTEFRWEVLGAGADASACDTSAATDATSWVPLEGTEQSSTLWGDPVAQPTRRSWFVNAHACGLRLVVDRTNAAPPVVREVQAIERASNVLAGGQASDDGSYPGLAADAVIDDRHPTRWAGAPGKSRWSLRVDLRQPQTIDRIRLVLGFDSTTVPRRGGGRRYAVAWAPIHYSLETSADGEHFAWAASEPVRSNGRPLPLRRRLVTLSEPRRVTALRLVMTRATGSSGLPEPDAVPVVREIAAYRAHDERPILAAPWILSVNANPSAQSHLAPGGEAANDAYHARFLHARLGGLLPFAEALESIEGDDPELDAELLARSSPPPIVALSGSNDWDYAADTARDVVYPWRWHWDPLRDAESGGMGQLARAVQKRVAPFVGFCGGAQILALLEARRPGSPPEEDLSTIDRVMQRTSGRPIRGFAPAVDIDRAWPTDPHPLRAEVRFLVSSQLFSDLAGPERRETTHALPEWHSDAIRPDAFLSGGPLERFDLIARSAFCAPDVVPEASSRGVFRDPSRDTWCATVPEAYRSRDRGWPIVGVQFHAEQRDFANAAPGDPPESVADARLFLAALYEEMVDAYETLAP